MPDINVNELAEAINDKMDRDSQNVDTTSGADSVIAFQVPTAENNYTWYRLYASGWVEQGGYCKDNPNMVADISFPVTMSDTNYTVTGLMDILSDAGGYVYFQLTVYARNTTGISIVHRGGSSGVLHNFGWQVSGMAAQ